MTDVHSGEVKVTFIVTNDACFKTNVLKNVFSFRMMKQLALFIKKTRNSSAAEIRDCYSQIPITA